MNKVVNVSRLNRLWILVGVLLISCVTVTSVTRGQEEAATDAAATPETVVASVEGMMTDTQISEGPEAAHNAWMLVCCALVLFMTAPGLAMFYGGLVRRKNVLSVMMQCVFLMGMMSMIWALFG
jgi:Amt family ammonium transporter